MGTSIKHLLWIFWIIFTLSCAESDVIEDLTKKFIYGVEGDLNTILHPIDSVLMTTVTKRCQSLKYLLGINYEGLKDDVEPDLNNLEIHFKTNKGRNIYKINEAVKKLSNNPHFDRTHKMVIFAHGLSDNPNKTAFGTISDAYLAKSGYNVLALDSSSLTSWPLIRASAYVRFIGEKLGQVLRMLLNEGISEDNMIIVGHSLGAYIGSYACKKFYELTKKRVGRLTGLDPVGPCFTNLKDHLRLKKTDAKFVDIIHTAAGVYGTTESMGHVDYYPNGGYNQPGCLRQANSHSRAWELHAKTILYPYLFIAKKCKCWEDFKLNQCKNNDTSYMGFASNPDKSGNYYLVTSGDAPYGLGKDGLKYTGGNGVLTRLEYRINGLLYEDKKNDQDDN